MLSEMKTGTVRRGPVVTLKCGEEHNTHRVWYHHRVVPFPPLKVYLLFFYQADMHKLDHIPVFILPSG